MFTVTALHAQDMREFTTQDSIKLGAQVEIKARHLRDSLLNVDNYRSDYDKQLQVDYAVEVFRIEEFETGQLEFDWSTSGMAASGYRALDEYDKLLNKYYKMLMSKLATEDKAVLKTTQQNWLKFRDSERELAKALWKDEYSGGGTLQRLVYVSRLLETTKQRVEELYYYNADMLGLD